ncbi:MAG: 23S rRNA (uracil(1939)-C(5))-methyltransferase RlmD [Eubacteriales bacterium]|nr:23S rRNA (uracil(1939)-C(5))-methyltransferase RlmD [Eubacteriales bacterium]
MADMIKKNDIYTVEITDMTNLGAGVARVGGRVIFVNGGVDGDTLVIKIIKVARDYCVARCERIVIPSPHRAQSACAVSNRCGGCVYRNITYEHELELKRSRVISAFRKAGLNPEITGVLNTGVRDGWRNKIQLPAGPDGKMGYYAPHSHEIIEFGTCLLHRREFDEIIGFIGACIRTNPIKSLRHLCLRTGEGGVMVCFVAWDEFAEAETLAEAVMKRFPEVKSAVLNINADDTNVIFGDRFITLAGDDFIEDILLSLRFRISPRSFYQVNRDAAALAYEKLREIAGIRPGDVICDLFCGIGTIGLYLIKNTGASRLIGVEVIGEAVENARINASLNGITNAEFIRADAGGELDVIGEADIIVVDPPRKGLSPGLISRIAQSPARGVVYMSCDPDTLARDCRAFCDITIVWVR